VTWKGRRSQLTSWISPTRLGRRSGRLDQFLALGFDVLRASLMADDTGIDLTQARKLVALGCPLGTAARILL
jgi:hypothetical protein